jgi:hypothetical protein
MKYLFNSKTLFSKSNGPSFHFLPALFLYQLLIRQKVEIFI